MRSGVGTNAAKSVDMREPSFGWTGSRPRFPPLAGGLKMDEHRVWHVARETRRDRASGADCASQDGNPASDRARQRVLANAVKPKLRQKVQ